MNIMDLKRPIFTSVLLGMTCTHARALESYNDDDRLALARAHAAQSYILNETYKIQDRMNHILRSGMRDYVSLSKVSSEMANQAREVASTELRRLHAQSLKVLAQQSRNLVTLRAESQSFQFDGSLSSIAMGCGTPYCVYQIQNMALSLLSTALREDRMVKFGSAKKGRPDSFGADSPKLASLFNFKSAVFVKRNTNPSALDTVMNEGWSDWAFWYPLVFALSIPAEIISIPWRMDRNTKSYEMNLMKQKFRRIAVEVSSQVRH